MDQGPLRRLLQALRRSTGPVSGSPDDDAQLLSRFLSRGDHNAFELLLWQHGPMVLGVCRRLLREEHNAEDAFQATFLTLIRKGRSITAAAALGSWLYRVAYRVALRLRTDLQRRAKRERSGAEELPAPTSTSSEEDLRGVLDEEINRLPARHRAAFVLCCLEGKTGAEAARELGCPPGTVSSRLTRARAQLQRRLRSRGLAPSAGLLVASLAGESMAAAVPGLLVHTTLEAARLFVAGEVAGGALSQQAITLVEGVVRAMSMTRMKIVTLMLLVVGLLAAGTVLTRPGIEAAPAQDTRKEALPQVKEKPGQGKTGKEGPVAVEVVKPRPGGLARTTTQPATVQAVDRAELIAPVAGYLSEMGVDIGDHVTKGQVLVKIDAPALVLREKQAAIAVMQAKAQLREAETRVLAARAEASLAKNLIAQREAELKSAKATAAFRKAENDRMKRLNKMGSIEVGLVNENTEKLLAARALESAATVAVENARSDLEVKQAGVLKAEAAVNTARLNVESAEVTLEQTRAELSLTRIVAPFDGVVIQRNYSRGDYVRPGYEPQQRPLLSLVSTGRFRMVSSVPQDDAPYVKPGLPAEVTVDALPGVRIACKVTRVGYAVNETNRTMRIELDIPDPKGQLQPGLTGDVKINLPKRNSGVLRVPSTAFTSDNANLVYVVRDGNAHRIGVRVSFNNGKEAEITSGLRPTDLVVVNPSKLSGPVVPVQIKKATGHK